MVIEKCRQCKTRQIASGIGYHLSRADLSLTCRYLPFEQSGNALLQYLSSKGSLIMTKLSF